MKTSSAQTKQDRAWGKVVRLLAIVRSNRQEWRERANELRDWTPSPNWGTYLNELHPSLIRQSLTSARHQTYRRRTQLRQAWSRWLKLEGLS